MPKAKGSKKKKPLTPQAEAQRKHKNGIRRLFLRLGFSRIRTDGKEVTFQGRTSELDDIFVRDNILVVAEYTTGQKTTEHVAKKNLLYTRILAHAEDWLAFVRTRYADAEKKLDPEYQDGDFQVRICYFAPQGASDEIVEALSHVTFVDDTTFRYFDSLAKSIHRSARFEFFKFLDLDFKEVGEAVKKTSLTTKTFSGYVLPAGYSSFPKHFKVVSFYADPNTLLTMSYVLRRDSWRDQEGMYQRVLQRKRMTQMRKYLTTEGRVFVNNIIVTLPDNTKLNLPSDHSTNIDEEHLKKVKNVAIGVPYESDAIGIVDGQHRVFCYYEGTDAFEAKIKPLRDRQNLLVTGIIYPPKFSESEKRTFEAKLFLEINDKQKRTGSELKQSIELVLNPTSTIAIAKAVVQGLNNGGALRGMLQTNFFDPPNRIKTSSIVSYGLRPLLKFDGDDSLFKRWKHEGKDKLKSGADDATTEALREAYVKYCVHSINALLIAAKKKDDPAHWVLGENAKKRFLSPTIINGYIVCLRLLIENKKVMDTSGYEEKLPTIAAFPFKTYKSSNWRSLGKDLYEKYFS